MTGYLRCLAVIGLIAVMPVYGFRIVSYNVENLFDFTPDSLHDDSEYTIEGARHWTSSRYHHKREQIARTIVDIGGWNGVAVVGLCEVENEDCVRDLCRYNLRSLPYAYIHFDSPDVRGIDVAMLYRTDLFRLQQAYPLRVAVSPGERPTRDILYATGTMPDGDTLHLYVCHLPSQLGGASRASSLRKRAKQTIAAHTDSILHSNPAAKIIVMGDMNSAPVDDLTGLHNTMLSAERQSKGTYKYQGMWSCIDQFYVSDALADTVQTGIYDAPWLLVPDEEYTGYKPARTYVGYQYMPGGYSDHLPIILDIPTPSANVFAALPIEGIIEDIYSQLTEDTDGSTQDFETLAEDLLTLTADPVPLNEGSYDALSELPFLSEEQISAILLKVRDIPLHSLSELQLVSGLKDYEIRNLLPFVQTGEPQPEPFYWREMAAYGRHDVSVRTDVRNIEAYSGTDPVYVQAKYGYRFQRKVSAGVTLRRPAAGNWQDLQYGGYVQLNDIGRIKRLVGGCYQAQFGQGLVTNRFFHTGKSSRVMQIGHDRQGLSKVSSAGSERYQGIGATVTAGRHTEVTGWYSVEKGKVWHHAIGANVNMNFRNLRVGVTLMEHLYSDSLPVNNTYYNRAYFRGKHQLVVGADMRYSWRWMQLFAEVAAAQNSTWGAAGIAGVRLTPLPDLGLVGLYRYYSPTFDNRFGYAFSESSRLGDEQGGYMGVEYKGIRHWRLSAYGDVFHFVGAKYGIRQTGTTGFEVSCQAEYAASLYNALLQLRSRSKGTTRTHRARAEFTCAWADWRLHTRGDVSLVHYTDGSAPLGYGVSVYQDIEYHVRRFPLVVQLRLQGFDVRHWDNRIYGYENDVLYAFSIPATYGLGGRWYVNMRYAVSRNVSLYMRVSETVYHPSWAVVASRPVTKTDIHLLLRAHW